MSDNRPKEQGKLTGQERLSPRKKAIRKAFTKYVRIQGKNKEIAVEYWYDAERLLYVRRGDEGEVARQYEKPPFAVDPNDKFLWTKFDLSAIAHFRLLMQGEGYYLSQLVKVGDTPDQKVDVYFDPGDAETPRSARISIPLLEQQATCNYDHSGKLVNVANKYFYNDSLWAAPTRRKWEIPIDSSLLSGPVTKDSTHAGWDIVTATISPEHNALLLTNTRTPTGSKKQEPARYLSVIPNTNEAAYLIPLQIDTNRMQENLTTEELLKNPFRAEAQEDQKWLTANLLSIWGIQRVPT